MTCSDMWVSILLNDMLDFLTHSNPTTMKLRETRTQEGLSINEIGDFRMQLKLYVNVTISICRCLVTNEQQITL